MPGKLLLCVLVCLAISPAIPAQTPPPQVPSSVWKVLLNPAMDAQKFAVVENVDIARDRVHILLKDGTIEFTEPAAGIPFGAVFHGHGSVEALPPNATEEHQLELFTKGGEKLSFSFDEAVFSSTDGLFEEIAKQVKWKGGGPADDLYARRQLAREDVGGQYLPRLFKSVLSGDPKRTAYFLADLKADDGKWVEIVDDAMEPEEMLVSRWTQVGPFIPHDVWMQFPAGDRDPRHVYDDPVARMDFLIPSYKIEASVAENADLDATVHVSVQPRFSGEKVLLFELDSNLRLSSVKDAQGGTLDFIQARESKDRIQSYGEYVAVVLREPTQAGRTEVLDFRYGGKRAVRKVGDGNYFCESFGWYPVPFASEFGATQFAVRSDFELTFRSPKHYTLVATGGKVNETTEGNTRITSWKSEIPLAVAGFAFGGYKSYTEKAGNVDVQVYANEAPDSNLSTIQLTATFGPDSEMTSAMGNLSAAALVKPIGDETANTVRLFQNYFGPYPYKQLTVTNIPGAYGQGWPGLLFLSWLTFLDPTQRHAIGLRDSADVRLTDFFRAHETSHQWWGHRVGWKSYHDQWLSEGFAEFSGMLYVSVRRDQKEFLGQMHREMDLLRKTDTHRHTVEQLGPIWMGLRIFSSQTDPSSYQNLIYSKGGYVLQMLRMQLYDGRTQDTDRLFKAMMQDYCHTFDNKAASTEDFKAIVEKHMIPAMDLDGNHKMNWFFNQYVYGTGIPEYKFSYKVEATADGKTHVTGELRRSNVPDSWKDVVPLYAQIGGKTVRLGTLKAILPLQPLDFTLPMKVEKLSIAGNADLLAEIKQ
ncbi:MAG TPA: M1 family aminopeptidase [Candidatus Acidoferrales bacterium]|nr:M1 family aminopeptidase [Candidatus Acidoferrales bacterium]